MLNLPSASNIIASSTTDTASVVSEFLPAAYLIIGVIVGAMVVTFVGSLFIRGVGKVIGKRRGRGRRRR